MRFTVALTVLLSGVVGGAPRELRPGVWAGGDLGVLPLPVSGYQVYLLGEIHGVQETEEIFIQYLARLHHHAGLRDVAIEEDAAYEKDAEDYVRGASSAVAEPLCLRAGLLRAIRRFNEERGRDAPVRVHLVDIDSPAEAIRQHLLAVKGRIPSAAAVPVPDSSAIGELGLDVVDELERRAGEPQALRELRTIRHSIFAYRQGLEVRQREVKGSPYLDDREAAVAANIQDLLRAPDCPAVLTLYGSDHVSKTPRTDGGAGRNRPFDPLALRLEQAGLDVFSAVTFPLRGRIRWRGRERSLPWTARDGHLADGEPLDRVLAAAPDLSILYVEPGRQRVVLPSRDISAFRVDAFLLLPTATPMEDLCPPP